MPRGTWGTGRIACATGRQPRRERSRDGSQGLEACAAWDLGRRLKPTLLKGNGRRPAVRKQRPNLEHLGANGTEGPFLALGAGDRLKHPLFELDLEPVKCLD